MKKIIPVIFVAAMLFACNSEEKKATVQQLIPNQKPAKRL